MAIFDKTDFRRLKYSLEVRIQHETCSTIWGILVPAILNHKSLTGSAEGAKTAKSGCFWRYKYRHMMIVWSTVLHSSLMILFDPFITWFVWSVVEAKYLVISLGLHTTVFPAISAGAIWKSRSTVQDQHLKVKFFTRPLPQKGLPLLTLTCWVKGTSPFVLRNKWTAPYRNGFTASICEIFCDRYQSLHPQDQDYLEKSFLRQAPWT